MNELFENKTRLLEEDLEAIMKVLKIGKIGKVESSGGEDSHGHNHRRRRSAGSLLSLSLESKTPHSVHRREVDDHAHAHETGTVRNIVIDLPFNFQDLIVNSPL